MDISALSLALGATPETVGQVTAEAGFDAVLEQVNLAGFIPPGAPPGPEPPPDLLVAGEEVEVVEPNAQPQKLDFHPLQKVDSDAAQTKPIRDASADTDQVNISEKSSVTADEAMKWIVGQMSDNFFSSSELASSDPSTDAVYNDPKLNGSKREVYYFCPPGFYDKLPLIDVESGWCGTDNLEPLNGAKSSQLSDVASLNTGNRHQKTVGPAIDQDILQELKVVSVDASPDLNPFSEKQRESIYSTKKTPLNTSDECPAVPEPVGFPTTVPKPVGFPTKTDDSSGLSAAKGVLSSQNADPKPDQKILSASADLVRTKPQRNSNSDERAVKFDGAVDVDSTVIAEKPVEEPTQDGSRSHDKKATSKSEWAELASAKRSGKPIEFEETKIDGDSKIDLSSAVSAATPELKKPSLKPEEAELVVKQVADKLHMLAAARPRNGVTIHLNPDDLGSITVVIKSVGRMVDTQITASDSRVSEALDQNRSRLVEAMDSKGYQLQSVSVSQQNGHSTQQDSSSKSWQQANQEQGQRQNQSGQQHGHRGHHDRHLDQPKANVRAWSRRNEGVDLAI